MEGGRDAQTERQNREGQRDSGREKSRQSDRATEGQRDKHLRVSPAAESKTRSHAPGTNCTGTAVPGI
eukprot:2813968-Rhodomonas_salina.2